MRTEYATPPPPDADEPWTILTAIRHLVREAKALGAGFRLSGYGAEIEHFDDLPGDLQAGLELYRASRWLWIYLGGEELDAPSLDLADELGIKIELIETRAGARRAVRMLIADARRCTDDGAIGFDIETMPLPEHFRPVWAKLNKNGTLAARQPALKGKGRNKDTRAGLNPHTAKIAAMQFYAGGTTCFVFRGEALRLVRDSHWLRRQHLIIHNAGFELKFLAHECQDYLPPAHRRPLGRFECVMQGTGLLHGVGFGGETRNLANMAKLRLRGLDVNKDLQVSDWGAPELSPGQLSYAAGDAAIAYQVWARMSHELQRKGRWEVYELQRGAAPATADMENRGILLDLAEHARQSNGWAEDLADARKEFAKLTGDPPPHTENEIRAWLTKTLTPAEFANWPLTPRNQELSTSIDAIKMVAYREDARAVIDIINNAKLLSTFGPGLADKISPVTNRLHPSFNLASTKAGRFSASDPNFQQTPTGKRAPGFRNCFIAAPGRVLVGADYSQIELRALAEIYQNHALKRVFAEGIDLHRKTAAEIAGIPIDAVTDDQRAGAKAVNFGTIYGMRERGLVGYAYSNYGVVLTVREAKNHIDTFFRAYHPIRNDLDDNAELCQRRGYIKIGAGRVVEAGWEKYPLSYQQCCNIPVQGVAADCMLRALTLVHDEFRGCRIRGGLAGTVHDELLVEVDEDDAEEARELLEACMLLAFAETFPRATLDGVVAAKIGKSWGDLK